ncbi:MAG: ATP synthase F1 subunit gamma [Candidatus Saccharimonadales bacterium]
MAQAKVLQRRIKSIANAKQITKAMELVAASRMRRVSEAAVKARIYSDAAISIVRKIAGVADAQNYPYLAAGQVNSKLYIIFTSDRGLAGAFNSNVLNRTLRAFAEDKKAGVKISVIVFGRKGARFFSRLRDITLIGEYEDVADSPDINVFAPVMETITHGLQGIPFNHVSLIFTEFKSTLIQQVQMLQMLPIDSDSQPEESARDAVVYEFEPSTEEVMKSAVRLYLESLLIRGRVESAASEHAMRMLAMNNANRNAGELIEDLTLELNATRQAAITAEMAEITGGVAAVS